MKRNSKGQFANGNGIIDLTGKRFGKLVVVCFDRVENKQSYWKVQCDCGTEKIVSGDTLKVITSCGCIKREQDFINFNIKNKNNHKMTNHGAFQSWAHMMERCYKETCKFYNDYGGRGVKVCKEWHDAKNFCEWAENNGFQNGLTIERKDVNGNYCPENCCWISKKKQNRNKRNTLRIMYNGENVALADIAEMLNLDYGMIRSRWYRGIRDVERLFYDGDLRDLRKEK